MKLLTRPIGALALLVVGAFATTKRQISTPKAALLGGKLHTAKKVSLDATTDKLQGVLESVTKRIDEVKGSYAKIKDTCVAQTKASTARLEVQNKAVIALGTTRSLNLERTAGLEASLANLLTKETEAHQSYETSVAQRATALQKHFSSNKDTLDQANKMGEVLEFMKQKRAKVTAQQTSTDDMKVVPPSAPTSSGSGLDFVIGVMSNIKDTATSKAKKGAEQHNEDDAGLEKLVTSYKITLQHIDAQYQLENGRRMEAKTVARDAADEKSLRTLLVNGEEELDTEFFKLCGADGNSGSVPAAIQFADMFLARFKQQSANAVKTMEGLPDLDVALLQTAEQQSQLRGASPSDDILKMAQAINSHSSSKTSAAQPATVRVLAAAAGVVASPVASAQENADGADSAQESAARWVMSQAAKFKDNATQQLINSVAASFPNGVPAKHPVRISAAPAQLHTLVGTARSRALQDRFRASIATAVSATGDDDKAKAVLQCVKDKTDLTDKILDARKAARAERTKRMSSAAREQAAVTFQGIAKKQKVVLATAQKGVTKGWSTMRDIITKKSFSTDTADAVTEMDGISKEVAEYIKAGGPPASAGLPKALEGITKTLNEAKARLEKDMTAINLIYEKKLTTPLYPALINQLDDKEKAFAKEEKAESDAFTAADAAATKQEGLVASLMKQRNAVDRSCLQAGQCGNLHYQTCCTAASEFTKQVSSWKECNEHCEGLLADGKQLEACEMTKLAMEDDRTGSGICSAHVTCTLKPSETKCAGSYCKAAPKKA